MQVRLQLFFSIILLFCGVYSSSAWSAKAVNGIGTEFAVYDAPGINFSPNSPPTEWYIPALRLRTSVGLYNLDPSKVLAELTAMRNSGQTDIAIPIWISSIVSCEHSSCNDGVYDGQWGEVIDHGQSQFLPQHKQNYINLLTSIKNLGFKRVIVRFNQYWSSSATAWDEARYQQIWGFIASTRNLTESTLGTTVSSLYDLGGELGGLTSGVNSQFTLRLWEDYLHNWGPAKTVGFSFAWAPGRFTQMKSVYAQAGAALPPYWAFDIYPESPGQSVSMKTHLQNIANEMGSLNAMPIIILETWHNDSATASSISSALNGPSPVTNLNLDGIFQWSLIKSRSLQNLDRHFSQTAIANQLSNTQISSYQPMLATRRIEFENRNSNALVLSDVNCATTSTVPCTINERWSGIPAGKIAVVTTIENGIGQQMHACVTSPGNQNVSWIQPGRTYHFIVRFRTACAIGTESPAAISVVRLQ